MKFCMVTTFFGAHSFGGDAAYVDRLSRALCRRGHEVHVFHCVDAFNSVKGDHPLRPYEPPPGLHVHPLESRVRHPLAAGHAGHRPALLQGEALREALDAVDVDVVHFHNISLVGGPGVLHYGRKAVRLMTAHEHWLICPMHLLWKYGKKPCDGPDCVRCMIAGGRPPQAWRSPTRSTGGSSSSTPWSSPPATRWRSTAAEASAPRSSTCPTSCPTTGPGDRGRPSPSPSPGPTSPPPAGSCG